jgi:uncharacterized membrane protein YedE/YeeE
MHACMAILIAWGIGAIAGIIALIGTELGLHPQSPPDSWMPYLAGVLIGVLLVFAGAAIKKKHQLPFGNLPPQVQVSL